MAPTTPRAAQRTGFGVDIGGTGIKAAPVDLDTGELLADRFKLPTPQPSTPDAVGHVVAATVEHFSWTGPVGLTFPAVIKGGVAQTAANVDHSWIGTNVRDTIRPLLPGDLVPLNDADAAGLAEVRFGAARGVDGVVLVLTLGTGIGSALVLDGKLFPSAELGHLEVGGKEAERRASAAVRERRRLSWEKWAARLQRVLETYEALLWPDLIVLGGGVSREADKFLPLLTTRATLVPAALQNTAGIVGAAIYADEALAPASPPPPARATATARSRTPATKTGTATAAKTTAAKTTATKAPAKKAAPAKGTAAAKRTTAAKRTAAKTPGTTTPPA